MDVIGCYLLLAVISAEEQISAYWILLVLVVAVVMLHASSLCSPLAAKKDNHVVRTCAEHLRQYNEALHQSNTIRMSDAFSFLHKYHDEEIKKKLNPDDGNITQITDTERFLFGLFKGIKTMFVMQWAR